jgi:hypothetical protein
LEVADQFIEALKRKQCHTGKGMHSVQKRWIQDCICKRLQVFQEFWYKIQHGPEDWHLNVAAHQEGQGRAQTILHLVEVKKVKVKLSP